MSIPEQEGNGNQCEQADASVCYQPHLLHRWTVTENGSLQTTGDWRCGEKLFIFLEYTPYFPHYKAPKRHLPSYKSHGEGGVKDGWMDGWATTTSQKWQISSGLEGLYLSSDGLSDVLTWAQADLTKWQIEGETSLEGSSPWSLPLRYLHQHPETKDVR